MQGDVVLRKSVWLDGEAICCDGCIDVGGAQGCLGWGPVTAANHSAQKFPSSIEPFGTPSLEILPAIFG